MDKKLIKKIMLERCKELNCELTDVDMWKAGLIPMSNINDKDLLNILLLDAKKYKTLQEYRKKNKKYYRVAHYKGWLTRCTNHMLTITDINKIKIENSFLKKGKIPKYNDGIYTVFKKYMLPSSKTYDADWSKYIKETYPEAFLPDWYKLMLKKMPASVKFAENQILIGSKKKYKFIHKQYGEFQAKPSILMYKVWPKNLSGHPIESRNRTSLSKRIPVKCNETGEIFESLDQACLIKNINRASLIRHLKGNCKNKTVGGNTYIKIKSEDLCTTSMK